MTRQSDSALRALLRIQARREKLEAAIYPAAMEQAGYWFKSIVVPQAQPRRHQPQKPNPRAPRPRSTPTRSSTPPYPGRVVRISNAGGLPPRLDFGPQEPEIVAALLRRAGHVEQAQSQGSRQ
jgi:hypothetical protein